MAAATLRERMRGFISTGSFSVEPSGLAERKPPTLPQLKAKPDPVRRGAARMYAAAQHNRFTADWMASGTSYDAELRTSLRALRNRSRQLVRDNDYAKNAMRVVRNNVIGQGVRMRAQVYRRRGKALHAEINEQIEEAFLAWCKKDRCHTAGKLSFNEIQRLLMGAVPESGEVLVRLVKGQYFGDSKVPLGLEIIESDQLVDDYNGITPQGNEVRMGVEIDRWQRPLAYWLYPRHPGDYSFMPGRSPDPDRLQRVPADEILHLFITERPNATRGVPWMHTAAKTLNDVNGTTDAEIIRVRAAACQMGFITQAEGEDPTAGDGSAMTDAQENGQNISEFEPGTIRKLAPGETYTDAKAPTPSANMETFVNFLVRKAVLGIGLAYESGSGDYSKVTYLSGRLSLINERDSWRVLQQWFIEHFLEPLFKVWMQMAVLAGVLLLPDYETNPDRYCCAWVARGWDWVDPSKDVTGAKEAIKAGLSTRTDELGKKGSSPEDIDDTRRRELDYQQGVDADPNNPRPLQYDIDPGAMAKATAAGAVPGKEEEEEELDENGEPVAPAKPTPTAAQ